MRKKSGGKRVCVSRLGMQMAKVQHPVSWPKEQSRTEHLTPEPDEVEVEDGEQPLFSHSLLIKEIKKLDEADDQGELHPVYDIECPQDTDGVLDNDTWDIDDASMSSWEQEEGED